MQLARAMEITIPTRGVELRGELSVPPGATGLVVFVHGSGSSRRSPRDQHLCRALEARGLATLLFDLLTPVEAREDEAHAELRSEVDFLAERLIGVTDWIGNHPALAALPLGYLGAGTGGAAALIAAARRPNTVAAVVSRGGRVDLADTWLERVRAPVLLVVGGADRHVLALNRAAHHDRLVAPRSLVIVPAATHLFETPGALDEVARVTGDWLVTYLARPASEERRALGDPVC